MTRITHHAPRCDCMSGEAGTSTHRAAKHFSRCKHSTLEATTRKYRKQTFRRLPGTKGVTVVLDGER
jgi:hypothetical protein